MTAQWKRREENEKNTPKKKNDVVVASGLGCAAELGNVFYKEILEDYEKSSFYNEDGSLNLYTVVDRTTELLMKHGLKETADIQIVTGITIYPHEYFCPINMHTGELKITINTYSIHRYASSWVKGTERIRGRIVRVIYRGCGEKKGEVLRKFLGRNKKEVM